MDLFLIFLIILIIFLILFFLFIYTAQKDINLRSSLKEYKAKTYNIKGEFSYDSLPLFSKTSLNDIFLSLVFPAYNEEKRLPPALEKTVKYFSSLVVQKIELLN